MLDKKVGLWMILWEITLYSDKNMMNINIPKSFNAVV